jgi:hypothetical protein
MERKVSYMKSSTQNLKPNSTLVVASDNNPAEVGNKIMDYNMDTNTITTTQSTEKSHNNNIPTLDQPQNMLQQ